MHAPVCYDKHKRPSEIGPTEPQMTCKMYGASFCSAEFWKTAPAHPLFNCRIRKGNQKGTNFPSGARIFAFRYRGINSGRVSYIAETLDLLTLGRWPMHKVWWRPLFHKPKIRPQMLLSAARRIHICRFNYPWVIWKKRMWRSSSPMPKGSFSFVALHSFDGNPTKVFVGEKKNP